MEGGFFSFSRITFVASLDSFIFIKKLLWETVFFSLPLFLSFSPLTGIKKLRLTDNALLWMGKHYESLIFN